MGKIKLFECYAGYGGASFALKKAEIPFKCVGYSEINKKQIQIYEQNHKDIKNFGDITKINPKELPDFDLITGGFPCQDVSLAGLRDLSKGRTKTVFKMLGIIKEKKPRYCLLENVEGILSILDGELFKEIIRQLKKIGYAVSWKLLYSKDYGTPQNRPRVWICCERDREPFMFNPFPKKEVLTLFVKDLLEKNVDEKYYLSEKQIKYIIKKSEKRGKPLGLRINPKVSTTISTKVVAADSIFIQSNITRTIMAAPYQKQSYNDQFLISEPIIAASRKSERNKKKEDRKNDCQQLEPRYDGCSNTITTLQKDNYLIEPKPLDLYNNKVCEDGICPTFTGGSDIIHGQLRLIEQNRIRCLTPRECFRLMGFFNDEINLDGIAKTNAYFSAGNGWDINLVSKIFRKWLI